MPSPIHRNDALRLFEDGRPHRLRLWCASTGALLCYPRAVCGGGWRRRALHRALLLPSGETRAFRDCCLFEIDGRPVYW